MQRKVYRTKLRPEHREAYIAAHRDFSSDLLRRYKEAGMSICAVYELGEDIVLLTEAPDHARAEAVLSQDRMNQEWQARLRPMKAEGDWQEMREIFFVDFTKEPA